MSSYTLTTITTPPNSTSFSSSLKSAFSDIYLLLWKNFKIQFRHPILSLFELLLPCLLVLLMSLFRKSTDVVYFNNATIYQPLRLNDFFYYDSLQFTVLYTPNTGQNVEIANETVNNLRAMYYMKIKEIGFSNSAEMVDYYLTKHNETKDGKVLCGIEFGEMSKQKIDFTLRFSSVPRWYKYSLIRENWFTANVMPDISSPGPREWRANDGGKPGYNREGFLGVQHSLTMAAAKIIHNITTELQPIPTPGEERPFQFKMLRFPFPPYILDIYMFALSFYFPAVIMFSFIYPSVNITKNLVSEKEKRLKESMKMMGLKEKYHWIAYFIKSLIWTLPSLAIVTALMTVAFKDSIAILNYTNAFVLFVFFLAYEVCNICLCFMISTVFSKANLAGIATGVIFFFSFIPFFTAVTQYSSISRGMKLFYCFLPNTNMAFGVYIISMLESRGVGLKWSNINEPAVPNDSLSILLILGMFLLNAVIYLIITWYITLAFPGEYGVPLKWYFPVTLKYWWESDQVTKNEAIENIYHLEQAKENFELDPVNFKSGIEIHNLNKTYDSGRTYSVKSLNLNTYYGQITALLGHNGAGKTTTISILTGLFKPTTGTALVNGHDIRSDMNAIRSSLGICPQFNVLFDELTVEEHLHFYCKLKKTGMSNAEIKQDVRCMIDKLDLTDKRKVQACKLSGGMKRKLSVGIALIGGSKVVILDEPTSGMDVSARRFIWDLLLKEKRERAIMISTHFMEEADILGDRIAIMADGKLQCSGSPLFLKKRFGSGYHLTVAKNSSNTQTELITQTIKRYIPNVQLESSVGVEVTYSLPDDRTEQFEPLLAQIEADQSLGVANYGISVTTMEEVFLKVGDYAKEKIDSLTKSKNEITLPIGSNPLLSKNHGPTLWFQQLLALILKKAIYAKRSPFLTAAQLLIPFIILNITLLSLRTVPDSDESPPISLELTQFNQPQVRFFHDSATRSIAEQYVASLTSMIPDKNRIKSIENTNVQDMVNEIITVDNAVYNYQFMISAIIEKVQDPYYGNTTNLIAMYNDQAYHTPPIALKYMHETWLRHLTKQTNISLSVTNHPLPLLTQDNLKISIADTQTQFEIMQGMILALAFLVSSFSVLAVKERVSKGKHLQKLSGVRASGYWLSYFLTDYVSYLLSSILMIVTFVIYKEDGLYQEAQPWYLLLGFVLHGLAVLPCIYVLTFIFSASATAYAKLCLYATVIGIATILSDQVTSIAELDLLDQNKVIKPIFGLFVPVYNLGKLASNLIGNYKNNQVCNVDAIQEACKADLPPDAILSCCKGKCNETCIAYESNPFSLTEPGIGRNLLYTIACSAIYLTLLVLIELNLINYLKNICDKLLNKYYYSRKYKKFSGDSLTNNGELIDEDVEIEKQRIESINPQNVGHLNPLVVRNLKKRYGKFVAVDQISYGVSKGECFGMLGVNGAGKTTTFKMITGDESVTSGEIFLNGMDLSMNSHRIQQEMGYCPQFDAILEDLTGRETLMMYSRLRGIQEAEIEDQISELSELLYFDMHLDKLVGEYSGGNRRKLSTAIALLGNPSISFLDEPTTGVDPVARRCLWEAIGKKLRQGCSVVLTSHSMEECEALCNRLIIMVNGQICCIGSPLQLKNKFGNGYTLQLRVNSSHTDNNNSSQKGIDQINEFMRNTFPQHCLKEMHNNVLHYEIEGAQVKCSQIFGAIERAKVKLQIEDYSVCQTNLEQIFLSFARHQHEEVNV